MISLLMMSLLMMSFKLVDDELACNHHYHACHEDGEDGDKDNDGLEENDEKPALEEPHSPPSSSLPHLAALSQLSSSHNCKLCKYFFNKSSLGNLEKYLKLLSVIRTQVTKSRPYVLTTGRKFSSFHCWFVSLGRGLLKVCPTAFTFQTSAVYFCKVCIFPSLTKIICTHCQLI